MAINTSQKAQIVADYQRGKGDTGSPEVQVALLTARINDLTDDGNGHGQGRWQGGIHGASISIKLPCAVKNAARTGCWGWACATAVR